jgi:enolase
MEYRKLNPSLPQTTALLRDARIRSLRGRRIWDSRGRPTIEAEVELEDGSVGLGQAPAGASTGSREARELRDGGDRLGGLDVSQAIERIDRVLKPRLIGRISARQSEIDAELIAADPSPEKGQLGGNTTLAVSLACARAAAAARGLPLFEHLAELAQRPAGQAWTLPLPQIQIFGGGAHAAQRIDIQDLMITCPAAASAAQALEWTARVYAAAGELMRDRGSRQGVADEGGWWPAFDRNEDALDALVQSIERAGLRPGAEVWIALDIAATQLATAGGYRLGLEARLLDRTAMIEMLSGWCQRYPILSIEDPLSEDDTEGFAAITKELGGRMQVVGDDYLVTDASRIALAATAGAANTVLLKPNQRGTISETWAAWQQARASSYQGIVSARSGETEDQSIVHLAIGWDVGQLKVGSFARGERTVKWNELLRLEDRLGSKARFAGWSGLAARRSSNPAV